MNITINTFGGFEIGDGEYFMPHKKLFRLDHNDFYIQTIIENDVYVTYFIPSPENYAKVLSGEYTGKDWVEMFSFVSVNRTTKEEALNYAKKEERVGIYEFTFGKDEDDSFVINDMMWYYLNLCSAGKTELFLAEKHPKYLEVVSLIEKYNKK